MERKVKLNEHAPRLELVHSLAKQLSYATELGAMAAARAAGFGDKIMADKEAVKAMRAYLNGTNINGVIVIGEGERDKAPMLYIGEEVGTGKGPDVDIAVDPLENTNATAIFGPRAISVLAVSERGGLFNAPDMYMDKLVVGKRARGKVSINASTKENLIALASALKRDINDLVIVVLKRERNEKLIREIRMVGARVRLIPDGDLMPGVAACMRGSGVHALMGIGAAPEGVMTAAAVKCLSGEMQARFWPVSDEEESRLIGMGGNSEKIYSHKDLASGKTIIFTATGVTDGDLLKGVKFFGGGARTQSLVISMQQDGLLRRDFLDTTHGFGEEEIELRM
jgi:fructose-1,6-bisphosphatase II